MLTHARLLSQTATRHPGRTALTFAGGRCTYAELDDLAGRMAGLLKANGVLPGDRVAVMLPNVPEFVVAYWGILRAGAVVVPINPLVREREIAFFLSDAKATAFVHPVGVRAPTAAIDEGLTTCWTVGEGGNGSDLRAALETAVPEPDAISRGAEDPAVVLYTSGTTGTPKGAVLTQSNLAWNTHVVATEILHATEHDVVFGALPLFHSFGQVIGMSSAFKSGATLSLLERFSADAAIDLIERERVTVLPAVPTMFNVLLNADETATPRLRSLRVCVSGGAAIPVEVLRGFETRFGCRILEGYGLSETSPVASFNHPDRASKAGSIGTPIAGVEMRIRTADGGVAPDGEIGEIQIRGHNVTSGYLGRPEATAAAIDERSWFSTGDVGRRDGDGYYFIVDRIKDLIIRGGYNVYPREVEEVLYEHPSVLEAAVIGVLDQELGEEVAAAVVVKPGAAFDADVLREHVRSRIAPYKYPRIIAQMDALPKGPTGKILKRDIVLQDLAARSVI